MLLPFLNIICFSELIEKELLSCGLRMYVCSLHEKECPCRLCSIAHVTVTWGCALQVTVSTSNSCCFPLQLFRVVTHWVAMRSWSLVRLNTSLERSVEPPLASMCSLDKENVFPRNAETSTSRETTRSPARRFAARSWQARWFSHTDAHLFLFWLPAVPAVSSERRLTLLVSCPSGACLNRSFLRAMSRQVPAATCCAVSLERRAAICIRCRCLTGDPTGVRQRHFFPQVTRKVNCSRNLKKVTANISSTFCMLQGSTDSVCGLSTSSALVSHLHLRPHGGLRVNRSRSAAPGNACGR